MNILVLGGTGMLGHMVAHVLSQNKDWNVHATCRHSPYIKDAVRKLPLVQWIEKWVDVSGNIDLNPVFLDSCDFIINCIGLTKPSIYEEDISSVALAISMNARMPYNLAGYIRFNLKIIQIATDCVYSGKKGSYFKSSFKESDIPDARDIYGLTKYLGEVNRPETFLNLRTSIIGPELNRQCYLWEWATHVEEDIEGYTNHYWNGVTTYHFAKIVEGIIKTEQSAKFSYQKNVVHIVPDNWVTKHDLVKYLVKSVAKKNILVKEKEVEPKDMRLGTNWPEINRLLWKNAGYDHLPTTIFSMIDECEGYRQSHF